MVVARGATTPSKDDGAASKESDLTTVRMGRDTGNSPSSSISTPQLTVAGVTPHSHCRQVTLLARSTVAPSSAMASYIQVSSPMTSSSSFSSVYCGISPQAPPIPFVYSTRVPPWSSSAYTSSPS
ncbi:hypothetical protein PIB30_085722 [Stylosanthes scabra]|uniref:Uncharacterized protein n=1 Tax=Stylosanthes scabra TaxID=79078 RepID=A0ABU6WWG5_9FABA|nr:hypothetical protein [Stylosanthes scabra]